MELSTRRSQVRARMKLEEKKTSHFYSSTEKALIIYLKRPMISLLWRKNLKFCGGIDFESGICLLGSFLIEYYDKAISFWISSCTCTEEKKKKSQKLAEARLAETPVESAVLQTGPSKVTPTWGSSGECNEGWGSTVLSAPSSGTQARKDGPMAQRAGNRPRGGGESSVRLGSWSKLFLVVIPKFYFCLYRGFTLSTEFSDVEKVASHEVFLIFWVPDLSLWKLSSEIPGSIYNTYIAFFTAASEHHNSLPLEKTS